MLNYDQKVACIRQAVKSLEVADALQQRALGAGSDLVVGNSQRIQEMINSLKADIESLDTGDNLTEKDGNS